MGVENQIDQTLNSQMSALSKLVTWLAQNKKLLKRLRSRSWVDAQVTHLDSNGSCFSRGLTLFFVTASLVKSTFFVSPLLYMNSRTLFHSPCTLHTTALVVLCFTSPVTLEHTDRDMLLWTGIVFPFRFWNPKTYFVNSLNYLHSSLQFVSAKVRLCKFMLTS